MPAVITGPDIGVIALGIVAIVPILRCGTGRCSVDRWWGRRDDDHRPRRVIAVRIGVRAGISPPGIVKPESDAAAKARAKSADDKCRGGDPAGGEFWPLNLGIRCIRSKS